MQTEIIKRSPCGWSYDLHPPKSRQPIIMQCKACAAISSHSNGCYL